MNAIKRNDKCPCGSGKKYKQCCMTHQKELAGNSSQAGTTARENARLMNATAVAHHAAGRLAQAEALYRQVLVIDPHHTHTLMNLGILAVQTGHYERALQLLDDAHKHNNRLPAVAYNMGISYAALGRFPEAERAYRRAIALKPDLVEALHLLARLLQHQGKLDEAVDCFERAVIHAPMNAVICKDLGDTRMMQGQHEQAIALFQKAVELLPDYAAAWNNLGDAQLTSGDLEAATDSLQKAICRKPDLFPAYMNLGKIHLLYGNVEKAVSCYDEAISIAPDNPLLYFIKGTTLLENGKIAEAREALNKIIPLDAGYPDVYRQIALTYYYQGAHDKMLEVYHAACRCNPDDELHNLGLLSCIMDYVSGPDPAEVFDVHRRFGILFESGLQNVMKTHPNSTNKNRRLRIGYVSGDFRRHSVSFFLEPVLAQHNSESFEIFCYSNHYIEDDMTRRLKEYAHGWRSIHNVHVDYAVQMIRDDGIDILVDLSGWTEHNGLSIFARRPAPVQVTWLGGLNTTGLQSINYRIVDTYTDPAGTSDHYHTEILWRMPDSFLVYQPFAEAPEVAQLPAIETGTITFGSFNSFAKMTPAVIKLWSALMNAVPTSRLLLKTIGLDEPEQQQRIQTAFAEHAVAADRLILKGRDASYHDHFMRYSEVDIALDPFPWNGGTTTCEAMWMGVPVISLAGDRFLSRMGVSMLNGVGLSDWVAQTTDEYVALAVYWSNNLPELNKLRAGLRSQMAASPLVDAEGFTRNLEGAYREMWNRWCSVKVQT